jgi:hypothetical protein
MVMVDHGNLCDDCNEAVPRSDEAKDRPEEDILPPVDEKSTDYKAGFQAGQSLEPSNSSKSKEWQRGWADAEE